MRAQRCVQWVLTLLAAVLTQAGAMDELPLQPVLSAEAEEIMQPTYLVKNGRSVGAILRDTRSDDPLLKRAEGLIQRAVREAGGHDLPVFNYAKLRESDRASAIAIGTTGYMTQIFGLGSQVADLGDEGFYIFPTSAANALMVVVTGHTERAVYHGVVHLADFILASKGHDLFIPAVRVKRIPALKVRGTYNLACWGRSPEYSADDWKRILDSMAEDSMNCIYFWLDGLFQSRRLPETFYYKNTRLTTQGVHELIAYAHGLGIEFYLGSGMFAWIGMDELAKTHPEAAAKGKGGLCPSNPTARRLMMEYLTELYDTFPEADGMFLEIRDEYGECECPACAKPLDGLGSRQYGASEIGFLRELAQAVWQKHPRAKFVSCIGYKEHEKDVNFYRSIREMKDPRLAWLVVRGNWEFPGEDGKPRPLTYFSPHMIHWKQYYAAPLKGLCDWIGRAGRERLLGCCPAFEPGFSSASFYSQEIPYPVDAIPYAVTRLAYREMCWSPHTSAEKIQERIRDKFLGLDAPAGMLEVMLYLFDLIREQAMNRALNPKGTWKPGVLRAFLEEVEKPDFAGKGAEAMREAEARLGAYIAMASQNIPQVEKVEAILSRDPDEFPPKARRALPLLQRALKDARQELCLTAAELARARSAAERLK